MLVSPSNHPQPYPSNARKDGFKLNGSIVARK